MSNNEAPLDRFQEQVRLGINEFIHWEVSGAAVLLVATIVAMILANSPVAENYVALWQTKVGFKVGNFEFFETLQHWINDFLMAFFFFVVGLEIKREVVVGELSSMRKAILPIVAAIGGMIMPALVYVGLNAGSKSVHGWGVPVATDIAFALGVLALLGSRIPASLKIFVTAMAIGDDIGAVLVIALFYTDHLDINWLGVAAALFLLLILFNLLRMRSRLIFFVVAVVIWFAFFESGLHATLAGILVAFVIPCRPRQRQPLEFVTWARKKLQEIERLHKPDAHPLERVEEETIARSLQKAASQIRSPLHRLEHFLHPIVVFMIIPLFALANAGIPLGGANVLDMLISRVGLGIILGLVVGKQLGVTLFTWLTVKLRLADLPQGVSWLHVYGASWLGGIGFTMALFVSSLAFKDPELLSQAKLSILVASLIAGVGGYLVLRFAGRRSATQSLAGRQAADQQLAGEVD